MLCKETGTHDRVERHEQRIFYLRAIITCAYHTSTWSKTQRCRLKLSFFSSPLCLMCRVLGQWSFCWNLHRGGNSYPTSRSQGSANTNRERKWIARQAVTSSTSSEHPVVYCSLCWLMPLILTFYHLSCSLLLSPNTWTGSERHVTLRHYESYVGCPVLKLWQCTFRKKSCCDGGAEEQYVSWKIWKDNEESDWSVVRPRPRYFLPTNDRSLTCHANTKRGVARTSRTSTPIVRRF